MARQKGFSVINLSGLTLGIASSLLILLYINDELSFDAFHNDAERIYRVTHEGHMEGKQIHSSRTGYPLAAALKNEKMLVEDVLQLANWPTFPMRYREIVHTEPNLLLAGSGFFQFFNFLLIEGNAADVLKGEGKIVITESAAKRYFNYKGRGDRSPLGQEMILAQGYKATITGIAEDPPQQSHFHFTFVLSLDSWTEAKETSWTSSRVITYVKIKEEITGEGLEQKLNSYTSRYLVTELRSKRIAGAISKSNTLKYGLQPLLSIHLNSDLTDEIEQNGNIHYIWLFVSVAAFITLLACINFMNLSTARSASRAREIGVRKTVGARNYRLVIQFLVESYFYIAIAVAMAMFIIMIVIGPFNILTNKNLDASAFFTGDFILGITLFVIVVGLLAGSYPAFYLAQFSPIEVLKGRIRQRLRSYGIRNALVVFQFFISSCLIIATLTVYEQLKYIQQLQVGFDKENILNLIHTANLREKGKAFKAELLKNPEILGASYSNRLPPHIDWQYVFRPQESKKDFLLDVYQVDYDHLNTMKYTMQKGRFFSPDFADDTSAVILNETAAELLKINNLLDTKIYSDFGPPGGTNFEVIGVVNDFHSQSLKDSIQPVALVLGNEPNWEMAIRLKKGEEEKAIGKIKALWKKFAPDAPFEHTYLDTHFEESLEMEKRVGFLFLLFTLLAIFIACLGLYGLATFTAEQRTKEIGIRKVLGASVENIVVMLNLDFLKLVLIANLIAFPVSWILLNDLWLTEFAYHISIPWWIFAVAATVTVVIASLSVSSRAVRAASGDPVNSLRDE